MAPAVVVGPIIRKLQSWATSLKLKLAFTCGWILLGVALYLFDFDVIGESKKFVTVAWVTVFAMDIAWCLFGTQAVEKSENLQEKNQSNANSVKGDDWEVKGMYIRDGKTTRIGSNAPELPAAEIINAQPQTSRPAQRTDIRKLRVDGHFVDGVDHVTVGSN